MVGHLSSLCPKSTRWNKEAWCLSLPAVWGARLWQSGEVLVQKRFLLPCRTPLPVRVCSPADGEVSLLQRVSPWDDALCKAVHLQVAARLPASTSLVFRINSPYTSTVRTAQPAPGPADVKPQEGFWLISKERWTQAPNKRSSLGRRLLFLCSRY